MDLNVPQNVNGVHDMFADVFRFRVKFIIGQPKPIIFGPLIFENYVQRIGHYPYLKYWVAAKLISDKIFF